MSNAAPQPKPRLTYEEEQEAFRRRHEGKEITIEAPKEPEVNPEVYRDVLALLFRGFVSVPAEIGSALFVFKSLNHHEFELLRLMGAMEKNNSYKYWDMLLSYNVLMIDGQNVLADRDRWLPKIIETFGQMDLKPKQRIIRYISEINRRANNAVILTEAYATESYSRYRWAQLTGIDLCSPSATGVPGTERLGMNWAQLTWKAINYYEDIHENTERDWENAKFIGSCLAGKGIQKVYQQDNDRRQKQREERFTRKDKILRQVLLGEKQDEKVKQLHGAVLTGAHTVEELAKQLEGDLRGEKDWHDQVVEEHINRIKRNIQGRQEQVREISKRHEEEFSGKNLIGGTDFSGLSIVEVQERITRRKQLEAQQAAQRMVRPDLLEDPKSRGFMDKWGISGEPGVNFSVQQTDQDPSTAVPIVPPKQGGTPFRRR
jgi:hypothetical protein